MSDHPYDPDLPYVVTYRDVMQGRFATFDLAHRFVRSDDRLPGYRISDTTPKPRVPDDAQYVMWTSIWADFQWFAVRRNGVWTLNGSSYDQLEDLPSVTPDTVFTVLDAREERKS